MFFTFEAKNDCDNALRSVAKGDKSALVEIYREYGKIIYSLAFHYSGSKSDSEDILQDTMLKIMKQAHNYRHGSSPKAWVLSVARSCALDYVKKRGNGISLDAFDTDIAFTTYSDEHIYIADALKTLTKDERILLKLRYYAGLDLKEAAKVLNISHSAARKRCQRALDKLKDYFDEKEEIK